MGAVRMGVPRDYVIAAQQRFGLTRFVETGTFHGATARWAAEHFPAVVTIEAAPALHERARRKSSTFRNIDFRLGDSRAHLRALVADPAPTLYWLDAHWSGGDTAGAADQCPVADEIAIVAARDDAFILVDDARLFLAPPPAPHDLAQWPTIDQLVAALQNGRRHIAVFEDVIYAVPQAARALTIDYMRATAAAEKSSAMQPFPQRPRWYKRLLGGAG